LAQLQELDAGARQPGIGRSELVDQALGVQEEQLAGIQPVGDEPQRPVDLA
jgi:hypothetical protein